MRIFLSFNSRDTGLAEAVRVGPSRIEPTAEVFFSPVSLGAGFWLPKLAEEIAEAQSFLLLIGPNGIGPWQEVEYFTAFDRHVKDKSFAVVPAIVGAEALGLPFLRTLNLVEASVITEDKVLHRLLAALKGETVESAIPLWKLVNPYRGLEAMNEANADYFYGRNLETAAVLNALASKAGRCPILSERRASELIPERQRARLACSCKVADEIVLDGEAWVKVPSAAKSKTPAAAIVRTQVTPPPPCAPYCSDLVRKFRTSPTS